MGRLKPRVAPRRLGLRQVAEPTVVDLLSDDEDGGGAQAPSTAAAALAGAPSFALLPTGQAAPEAVAATTLVEVTEEIVEAACSPRAKEMTPLHPTNTNRLKRQRVSSGNVHASVDQPQTLEQQQHGSLLPPLQQQQTKTKTQPASPPPPPSTLAPSVFHLYQDGPTPEHKLQLHFIRRKPRRSTKYRTVRLEDEFILPRPHLTVADVLPSTLVSIDDLHLDARSESTNDKAATNTERQQCSVMEEDDTQSSTRNRDALQSLQTHWPLLDQAPHDVRGTWRVLHECDWFQIARQAELTHSKVNPDENGNGNSNRNGAGGMPAAWCPSLSCVTMLLTELQSDALAMLVWRQLLVPLLQQVMGSPPASDSETLPPPLAQLQKLFTALLRHDCMRLLSPKEFRAQLRAMHLSSAVNSAAAPACAALVADAELLLVTLFHQLRK